MNNTSSLRNRGPIGVSQRAATEPQGKERASYFQRIKKAVKSIFSPSSNSTPSQRSAVIIARSIPTVSRASRPLPNHQAVLRQIKRQGSKPLPADLTRRYRTLVRLSRTTGAVQNIPSQQGGLKPGRIQIPRRIPTGIKVLPSPPARGKEPIRPLSRRVRVQPPLPRPQLAKVQAIADPRLQKSRPVPPPPRAQSAKIQAIADPRLQKSRSVPPPPRAQSVKVQAIADPRLQKSRPVPPPPPRPQPAKIRAAAPQNPQPSPEVSRIQEASINEQQPEDLPVLYHHLNDYRNTLKNREKALETFSNLYRNHRDKFDAIMRNEGLTDLETSFLFNHFITMHEAFSKWNKEFEQLVELAKDKEKTLEVIKKFRFILENHAPSFIDSLNKLSIISDSLLSNKGVARAITKFGEEMKEPNFHHLVFSRLYNPRASQELLLFYRDAVKHAEKGGLQELEELENAPKILIDKLAEANEFEENFQRRFKTGNQFIDFFNFEGLDKAQYHKILKKHGWTEGWFSTKIEKFNELNNKLAQCIKPLKESKEAIESETDPVKKQELRAQRKQLVKKILPQARRLRDEYNRLGGKKQLNSLIKVAKEIILNKELFRKIYRPYQNELYILVKENPEKYNELQLSSERPSEIVYDLMDHLEGKIAEVYDGHRARRKDKFKKELTLVHKLAYIKDTVKRGENLVNLFLDRLNYLLPRKRNLRQTTRS